MTFRRMVSAVVVLVSGAAGAFGIFSCGPSFQAVYEGNVRFEHCYAVEERPQLPLKEKADCWRDWSERYTYGQTRDRIQYATARYVALSQSVPTDEAMENAAPGQGERSSQILAPMPTNAFAPPPKVLDLDGSTTARPSHNPVLMGTDPSLDAGPDAGPVKPMPGAGCLDTCGSKFHDCKAKDCDAVYKTCAKACFK